MRPLRTLLLAAFFLPCSVAAQSLQCLSFAGRVESAQRIVQGIEYQVARAEQRVTQARQQALVRLTVYDQRAAYYQIRKAELTQYMQWRLWSCRNFICVVHGQQRIAHMQQNMDYASARAYQQKQMYANSAQGWVQRLAQGVALLQSRIDQYQEQLAAAAQAYEQCEGSTLAEPGVQMGEPGVQPGVHPGVQPGGQPGVESEEPMFPGPNF